MGLLSRLRHPSSKAVIPPSQSDDASSRLGSPRSPSIANLSPLVVPSPSFAAPAPPSPSGSSISSRINPWKKGKGKEKDDASIAGPAYTPPQPSHSYTHFPPNHPAQRSYSSPVYPQTASYSNPLPPLPAGQAHMRDASTSFSVRSRPVDEGGRKRLSSGEWRREGGFIGKLGFEKDGGQISPPLALQPSVMPASPPFVPLAHPTSTTAVPVMPAPSSEGSMVFVSRDEAMEANSHAAETEDSAVEVLDSGEKKQKFWHLRRSSRSGSEVGHDVEELASPTPRKKALPSTPLDHDSPNGNSRSSFDQQGRPRQIRRPSSSFFFRTQSRTSIQDPLDVQPGVDDGSFQLRSFRHISGTSDVEGAGELETYLSHVKRSSRPSTMVDASTSMGTAPASTPAVPTSQPSPATPLDSDALPPPRRPNLSRPPSSAGSLTSMDDHMKDAPRMSAAAFRKGIRKPSDSPMTPASTDSAAARQSMIALNEPEDEDDVPLGLLQSRRHESQLSLPLVQQDAPAISPPLSQLATARAAPLTEVSPPSGSNLTVRPSREQLRQMNTLRQPSPSSIQDSHIAASSPIDRSPVPIPEMISRNPTPSSVTEPAARVPLQESPRSPPPPVQPIQLPQPGDTTPSVSELPLPPDQMPSTPPATSATPIDETTPSAGCRGGHGRKASLLEEPLRVISNLWMGGTPPSGEVKTGPAADSFDPALVMRSMEVFGAGRSPSPSKAATLTQPDEQRELPSASAQSQPRRLTLQDRLASVAGSSPVSPISTLSTTVPVASVVAAEARVQSSFARAPPIRARASVDQLRSKKTSWSDSEDEDDDEDDDDDEPATSTTGSKQAALAKKPSVRKVPGGPRKMSIRSREVSGASTVHPAGVDSIPAVPSIGITDHSLATQAAAQSRPTLAYNNRSDRSTAKTKSASSYDLSTPLVSSSSTATSRQSTTDVPHRSHVASPSPASSQSGVTSETLPQAMHPMTPRETQVGLATGPAEPNKDAANPVASAKPALPRLSSAYRTDALPRRMSTATAPGGAVSDRVSFAVPPSPTMTQLGLPTPSGVDPQAYRQMMKQQWQAQYMAAAFRASEQEWERQSTMSESGRPDAPAQVHGGPDSRARASTFMPAIQMPGMPGVPPLPGMPIPGYLGMPDFSQAAPYGYPFFPPPMPMGMPPSGFGPMPSSPSFGPGMSLSAISHQAPASVHGHSTGGAGANGASGGQGMYSFSAGPQSVFGGEFGPPSYPLANPYAHMGGMMGMPYAMPPLPGSGKAQAYGHPSAQPHGHPHAHPHSQPSSQAAIPSRPRSSMSHSYTQASLSHTSMSPPTAAARPTGGMRQSYSSAPGWGSQLVQGQTTPRKGSKLVN